MKFNIILYAVLLFSISIIGCEKEEKVKPEESSVENSAKNNETNYSEKKAPDFSLTGVDGKTVKLSDYKNKIVILDFWATWCGPCRKGIPDLIELQKEYKNDLIVIGISLDSDTKSDIIPFMEKYNVNYPVVYGNLEITQKYGGIRAIPTSFIIDKNGNIIDQHIGLIPKEAYSDQIKSLLKKS